MGLTFSHQQIVGSGSGTSSRSVLIRSWGRASLCTDSEQCGSQEVFGVENNIK